MLVNNLPKGVAQFGKRLTSYHYDGLKGAVQLQFSDGTSTVADVLLGCDGIKSVVRKQMFEGQEQYANAVWSGTVAYRGIIDAHVLRKPDGGHHSAVDRPMMVRPSRRAPYDIVAMLTVATLVLRSK